MFSYTTLLKPVAREGETRIYEYTRSLPRVYIADTVRVTRDEKESLQQLFDEPFTRLGVWAGHTDILNVPVTADETAVVTAYGASGMRVNVTVRNTRLLVILNRFDRRWQVTADGKSSVLYPVNYLFMGLTVTPGTHDIILSYR